MYLQILRAIFVNSALILHTFASRFFKGKLSVAVPLMKLAGVAGVAGVK